MDTTPRLGYSAGTASTSPYTQNGVYPSQAPPAYTTVLRRVYPYSMRPVLLISTFISFLYLAIVAIASFRSTSWAHETTRLKLLDILIGALLLPAAIIEVIGFTAAYTCRLHLARLYSVASVAALALTVAADVLAIVEHYVVKGDLINGCTQDNTGRIGRVSSGWGGWFGGSTTGDDSTTPWTADQARAYCTSQWNRDGIWTIVWLIIILFIGALFLTFAFTFVHQLRHQSNTPPRMSANAFTADDESAPFDRRYSYEATPQHQQQHAYPPPPGMPPQYNYDDEREATDAKDPNLYSYSQDHDDEYHTATSLARAESSRSAAAAAASAAAHAPPRTSQDTLTDEHAARDKTPQI